VDDSGAAKRRSRARAELEQGDEWAHGSERQACASCTPYIFEVNRRRGGPRKRKTDDMQARGRDQPRETGLEERKAVDWE